MAAISNLSQPSVSQVLTCPDCCSTELIGCQEVLYVKCDIWVEDQRVTIDGGEPEFGCAEAVGVDCRVCDGAWDADEDTELTGIGFDWPLRREVQRPRPSDKAAGFEGVRRLRPSGHQSRSAISTARTRPVGSRTTQFVERGWIVPAGSVSPPPGLLLLSPEGEHVNPQNPEAVATGLPLDDPLAAYVRTELAIRFHAGSDQLFLASVLPILIDELEARASALPSSAVAGLRAMNRVIADLEQYLPDQEIPSDAAGALRDAAATSVACPWGRA